MLDHAPTIAVATPRPTAAARRGGQSLLLWAAVVLGWLVAAEAGAESPAVRFRPVITKAQAAVPFRVVDGKKVAIKAEKQADKAAPEPDDLLDPAPAPDDNDPPAPLPANETAEPLDSAADQDHDLGEAPLPEESTDDEYFGEEEYADEFQDELDAEDESAPEPEDYLAEEYLLDEDRENEISDEDSADGPTEEGASPLADDEDDEELPAMKDEDKEDEDDYEGESSKKKPKTEKVGKGKSEPNPDLDGLTPVAALRMNIVPSGDEFPQDYAGKRFEREGAIHASYVSSRPWAPMYFSWEATALCHSALYFEEPNLERLGYSAGIFQPAVSAAHFFGTIPALPYLMAAHPQKECVYTLGQYRAGSHAPLSFVYPRIDPKAALFQGGVVAGLILLIP